MAIRHFRWATVATSLKILVWVVIAGALVKIAFFPPSSEDASAQPDPHATFGQMTITPYPSSITNTISLEGTIEPDAATPVKATSEGKVNYLFVEDGAPVVAGQRILQIEYEVPGEDVTTTDEDGNTVVTPGQATKRYANVTAPADGTLKLDALIGQQFAIGDSVGSVQPSSFSAVASLTPDQMYRIDNFPETAQITIKNGPAPFTCEGLTAGTTSSSANKPSDDDNNSAGSSTSLRARCAIPADQKVFAGLQVTMQIVGGEAADVLVLPVTAVEGRYQTGYVYVPTDDPANPEKVPVKLGITDGNVVQIVEGLTEEQEVLEYVPGQTTEDTCDPMTGEGC
ncbi:MAG: efflux RND transporter periplasmic adaptor subunit [Actinomycetaceae bacterium]|nr:efflux RND transporter periplasmic adaptor subunit [Actinomycetaceae bacterium]